MLKHLAIQQFALIDQLELDFGAGLNIITGETGAGKSIIVDALSLLLGERASATVVRSGAKKAVIEGIFDIRGNRTIEQFLERHEFEPLQEGLLLLRREIYTNGLSRAFVNDTPAKVATLKELGNYLVDFHGQHEHQSLLRVPVQQKLLDNVGGLEGIVEQYQQALQQLKAAVTEYESLQQREQQLRQEEAFNRFRLEEIEHIDPQPGEEEALERELSVLENAEFIIDALHQLSTLLYEGEAAIRDQLIQVRSLVEQLQQIDRVFDPYRADVQSAIVMVEEFARFVQRYESEIEFDPQRIEHIRQRLSQLRGLIRKYGSLEQVLAAKAQLQRELELAENFEEALRQLEQRIAEHQRQVGKIALKLSHRRRKVAAEVEKQVEQLLQHLGIAHPTFRIQILQHPLDCTAEMVVAATDEGCYRCFERGIDSVEFFISTNVGEEPKPLVEVASGGEISRIMLALKTILAKSDRLPMLVFDEIDVGISGRIAQKVGKALKNLSRYHQIIAITHLPQIAALADEHIVVQKQVVGQRTVVTARSLPPKERLYEVARLMGGEEITDALLESARQLTRVSNGT